MLYMRVGNSIPNALKMVSTGPTLRIVLMAGGYAVPVITIKII